MCLRIWDNDDDEGLDFPLPLAQPRLTWAVPVSMSELGASVEAFSDTIPQVTTLQLCHRFSQGSLSRLPQEIVEQIINEIRRLAYDSVALGWHHDFKCFQNRCAPEDHFHTYGPHVETAFDSISAFIEDHRCAKHKPDLENLTDAKKTELVQDEVGSNPGFFMESDDAGLGLHFRAQHRFIRRTCLCFPDDESAGFCRFNKVLKSYFGLEAVIMHEIVDKALNDFVLKLNFWLHEPALAGDRVCYTLCYLALASETDEKYMVGGRSGPEKPQQFGPCGEHKAFQQVIDPSLLTLSENQRIRFNKAMRLLGVSPHYHFSELEPHVQHPIDDEVLMDLCVCFKADCDATPDLHSWDKAWNLEELLKEKSKELAKETWPKLMIVSASDMIQPSAQT